MKKALKVLTVSIALAVVSNAMVAEAERVNWAGYARKTDAWYRSEDGKRVAENILSWQSPQGSWPKNLDTVKKPYTKDRDKLRGTYDNGATFEQTRFLARAYGVTEDKRYKKAALRAIDDILAAQYPNGGWPQYHPSGNGYPRYITFNDDAMVLVMRLMKEITESDVFAFIGKKRREKAAAAFARGIECMLDCQVEVDGELTAWCAQHDEVTLEPRKARSYEHPSLSGQESVGVVLLLMEYADPGDKRVARAINSACEWFDEVQLKGIRCVERDDDRVIIPDPDAPPLWARFYDIGTNTPIFSGRDGVIKYKLSEIEQERRGGYAWYGDWPSEAQAAWPKWKEKRRIEQ